MRHLLPHFLQELLLNTLGADGLAACFLFALAFWFGHYAVRERCGRPGQSVVLAAVAVFFVLAASYVVKSAPKLFVLFAVIGVFYLLARLASPKERRESERISHRRR